MSRPAGGIFSRLNGTSKSFGFILLKDNNDSREGQKAPRQGRVRVQATMTVEKTGRRRAGAKPGPVAKPGPRWPADAVERRAVATLVPSARNARTHSDQQVAQSAASIREFGWTFPVLVDEQGTIVAGHGRVLAAQKLGIAEIPVMVAAGWSEAKRRLYVIADNKLALNAGWDEELLSLEIPAQSSQHRSPPCAPSRAACPTSRCASWSASLRVAAPT